MITCTVSATEDPTRAGASTQPHGLALAAHLLACARARGRGFELNCFGERLHGIVGPRFFTTIFAAAAVMSWLVLAA